MSSVGKLSTLLATLEQLGIEPTCSRLAGQRVRGALKY